MELRFKPMLARGAIVYQFPTMASPKLDGVRACVVNGTVVSRSAKPIPNRYVQQLFGHEEYNGFDGELIVGSATDRNVMQNTTSGVMTIAGKPDVYFYVFDHFGDAHLSAAQRNLKLINLEEQGIFGPRVRLVQQVELNTAGQLAEFEAGILEAGFEGVMLKDPSLPYKFGRTARKEFHLIKVKRFIDGEAEIVDLEPLFKNENPAFENELGYTARSHSKDGLVETNMLGAFVVRDLETDCRFKIGTGFTENQRKMFMDRSLIGQIVVYKHFDYGVKDAPRFPVFKSFRSKLDL